MDDEDELLGLPQKEGGDELVIQIGTSEHQRMMQSQSSRRSFSSAISGSVINKQIKAQIYLKNMQLQVMAMMLISHKVDLRQMLRIYQVHLEGGTWENKPMTAVVRLTHLLKLLEAKKVFTAQIGGNAKDEEDTLKEHEEMVSEML
jgi:hypothetical protein